MSLNDVIDHMGQINAWDPRSLLQRLQHDKLNNWQRRVSVGDLLTDRTENARMLGWGEGSTCYDNVLVLGDVRVGRNTWVGPNVILDGSGGTLEIGDYCSICPGVQIYTHDSARWANSMGEAPFDKAPTKIGSGVFIGANSVVVRGVTIGDRATVGAMSLVLKDVSSEQRVLGVHASEVREFNHGCNVTLARQST